MPFSDIDRIVVADIHKTDDFDFFGIRTPMLAEDLGAFTVHRISGYTDKKPVFIGSAETDGTVMYLSPALRTPRVIFGAVDKYFDKKSFTITAKGITVCKVVVDGQNPKISLCAEDMKLGANADVILTRGELHNYIEAERCRRLEKLYESGVEIPCFDGVEISYSVEIQSGAVILSGTKLSGNTKIGSGSVIGPNSMIHDGVIGKNCTVEQTKVTSSTLEDNVKIGPFSQVRPNCVIGSGCKIGDFVEIKNSNVGSDTHASHLTYIGDADVGRRVNFGCGTVISNYDGNRKYRCTVGDDSFIGCNTNLISPVCVGNGAFTAAGSTITKDVPENALAVARARQTDIPGWAEKHRSKK